MKMMQLYYIETGSEHPNNVRFLADSINLSTLSEATSTPVCLTCCESARLIVRMVLLPSGIVIRYPTIKHK